MDDYCHYFNIEKKQDSFFDKKHIEGIFVSTRFNSFYWCWELSYTIYIRMKKLGEAVKLYYLEGCDWKIIKNKERETPEIFKVFQ